MIVYVTSIVRNATGYLDRYFSQAEQLKRALLAHGDVLRIIVGEGDSTDGTWQRLMDTSVQRPGITCYQLNHGGPEFGSIDNPTRWQNIARTWNGLYDHIRERVFDAAVYVEADLIWEPQTMLRLLKHLERVPAVAPMSMHQSGFFYDTWGHRAQGQHFGPMPPYHPGLAGLEAGQLFQLESAGSCMVMRGQVARTCRFSEADAMLGHDIYATGFSLWLDPRLSVFHP